MELAVEQVVAVEPCHDDCPVFFLSVLLTLTTGCFKQQQYTITEGQRREGSLAGDYSPKPFHSNVLRQSPIVRDITALPADPLSLYLHPEPVLITQKSTLTYDCEFASQSIDSCMQVKQTQVAQITRSQDDSWVFPYESPEFLEVNAFYHAGKAIEEFFRLQLSSLATAQENGDTLSSLPQALSSSPKSPFWFHNTPPATGVASPEPLTIYTHCEQRGRPFFVFATREVCLGDHQLVKDLNYAEDPDIIHHELGHFLSTALFNQRNIVDATLDNDRRTSFGGYSYSEVDLLSEGISDWFAHHHSEQTELFEWAGGFTQNSRPVSETSNLHNHNILGIAPDAENRLHYPGFINYYQYDPSHFLTEDVQQAGMIISHFLFALALEIEQGCNVTSLRSRELVFTLMQETLNEIGDLTTKGSDAGSIGSINFARYASDTWVRLYTPPNPRLFAQKIAKHFKRIIDGKPACNDNPFSQSQLEELIDSYGLLLFRTYNENGNCSTVDTCREGSNTTVFARNRKLSTLLSKQSLRLDQRENQPSSGVFVFDKQAEIKQRLNSLRATGIVLPQDLGHTERASVDNNNDNGQISPGEIIGIALNIFNNANIPMGGVQTLANDWDHVKVEEDEVRLCNTFEDDFPAVSNGGASSDSDPPVEGDCTYVTRENGQQITESKEIIAPICSFLYKDETRPTG